MYVSGLKDLADFLPASMATIVSYLSAETTRGLWKPAAMNGTDWPSPATSLAMVEKNMNKILSATGVDVPSLSAGLFQFVCSDWRFSVCLKSVFLLHCRGDYANTSFTYGCPSEPHNNL